MAESLGVIEIVYDNQLIAYLIRDTLTPYCAVIALGISDQKKHDYMVERLENCPCEIQWWLIARDVSLQLSWVNKLVLRFTGQLMLAKACLINTPNNAALDLSNSDTLEHNEILHLGHLMLTIQYIKANSLKVSLLVCDNMVFCLPSNALQLSSTCMGNVLKQSNIKWDKFSEIYSPSFTVSRPLSTSKLTFWQLEARLSRNNLTDTLKN
ncbi:hypothetical protein L3V43_23085 [Pseudoalteromonas sp. L23]|uniref:hypothetical protein n=1 Tax=unclassified Pseudoalteromonas TaxID=194690 RepID=UPI001F281E80|nr:MULTISPECIES: hypothetical protein [unclassified Pseudoalteromonas]MCF2828632.1 hypothetical protein [Pseudoalteromonas sp. OF5H-5]MCF2833921.1 hypothetical protein [Pseudoalteromonas sp. DL2-H6]MCF2924764.1 hypothetical protein [Pseudoalteromonas sp. DL2-H1]MCF7516473.1 hypothetical protein [Pseudoalteromonas sp. L7]MCF7528521.1 hypothetical protein [Pseudoalteromonas sp. L23]